MQEEKILLVDRKRIGRLILNMSSFKNFRRNIRTYLSSILVMSNICFLIIENGQVGIRNIYIKNAQDSVILGILSGSKNSIQFMKSGIFEIQNIILSQNV